MVLGVATPVRRVAGLLPGVWVWPFEFYYLFNCQSLSGTFSRRRAPMMNYFREVGRAIYKIGRGREVGVGVVPAESVVLFVFFFWVDMIVGF